MSPPRHLDEFVAGVEHLVAEVFVFAGADEQADLRELGIGFGMAVEREQIITVTQGTPRRKPWSCWAHSCNSFPHEEAHSNAIGISTTSAVRWTDHPRAGSTVTASHGPRSTATAATWA
jgi:hypothetical protein